MPVSERFYRGTRWVVATGPEKYMGLVVVVIGEVFERDDELYCKVEVVKGPHKGNQFEADLSWLS